MAKTSKTTKTTKKPAAKAAAKKAAPKKVTAKKPVAKKPAAKPVAKKPTAKKSVAKKLVAKKLVAKKPVAKKPVAQKAVVQKAVAKKAVAEKAVTKKVVTKKVETKKPVAKKPGAKTAAQKPSAKKAVAKKLVVGKPVAKKPVAKKPAAKKPAAKKTVAKKPAAKKAAKAPAKPRVNSAAAKKAKLESEIARHSGKLVVRTTSAKTIKPPMMVIKPTKGGSTDAKPKKPAPRIKAEFATNEFVVYPTHGVGKIVRIEDQEVSGAILQLFVIDFAQDKMTLRVPLSKAKTSGMRRLSTTKEMDQALTTLKGRARVKRTMWSRRAQEYEAKINSGDPIMIAEVVRDLHRNSNQPDQSYSERQIYEAALGRLAREFAAVDKTDEEVATEKLETVLTAA